MPQPPNHPPALSRAADAVHALACLDTLPHDWAGLLANLTPAQLAQLRALDLFLASRAAAGATILPPAPQRFAAFAATPVAAVRVVILGQDPYHGLGQAHGLAFSVPRGIPVPASLRNILREIATDPALVAPSTLPPLWHPSPTPPAAAHGDLSAWAAQGVLLLNTVLSVEEGQANSHAGQGWEILTSHLLHQLSSQRRGLVFMLWGTAARRLGAQLRANNHQILEAAHPSPLAAHRGFLGCQHFSKANAWLQAHGATPINWQRP